MNDIADRKQISKELRQAHKYDKALELYRELWAETGDAYDGAGLLHCLRKQEMFEEATIFARELISKYPSMDWCRNEVIWTMISGKLTKYDETSTLGDVLQTAKEIMELRPEGVAAKMVVFKVLKTAKAANHWETVAEWVTFVDPNTLSTKAMTDRSGREGWSDQAVWYNYRIRCHIQFEEYNQAVQLVDDILEKFSRQRKFFLRLKAKAQHCLGQLEEAEEAYRQLCDTRLPDWWILNEYARVVRDKGDKGLALKILCQAANSHSKLDNMVTLFADLGRVCAENGKDEEARSHLLLCKHIRDRNGWSVPEDILHDINELNDRIPGGEPLTNLSEELSTCRDFWKSLSGPIQGRTKEATSRKVRRGLVGLVKLTHPDRPFCFIVTEDNESIFCSKSDLPMDTSDRDTVSFDAVPSFDKKKKKESWKAANISTSTGSQEIKIEI